ncbi:MAG: LysR family transcriptional regulator [Gammaproteobacteria bacterium]|nr:LysR family transcriptional regulator [Gammaproteobacteria bacterium]
MNITLKYLRYTVAVAKTGSIAAAARANFISESGIANAINLLESELEVQIFERRRARGMRLTPNGQRIVDQALRVLDEMDLFMKKGGGEKLSGPLDIGVYATVAPILLPGIISEFARSYPDVNLHVREGDLLQIQDSLLNGEVNMILTYDHALRPDQPRVELAQIPYHVVLGNHDPLIAKRRLSVEDIADNPIVLLDQPVYIDSINTMFRLSGLDPDIAYRARSYQMACELVGAGLGRAILNLRPRVDITYQGDSLVRRPLRTSIPLPRLVIAKPANAPHSDTLEAFIELCQTHIGVQHSPFAVT